MLSQTAEYALRAVVTLATGTPEPRTAQDIAAEARVPLDYLSKVLQSLARAGIVTGQRGRGGGFQSIVAPGSLTVLQVINAVDPIQRIRTCPLGLKQHGENLCPLHRKLDDAMLGVEQAFGATTIESIVGKSFWDRNAFCEGSSCDGAA
jgi:Rrf2 family protein